MARSERIGRIIGVAGAACGSLFWSVALYSIAGLLIEPKSATGLALLILMPMVIFASVLLVVSAAGIVVLVRRIDIHVPAYVALSHAVMALAIFQFSGFKPRAYLPVGILVAVALSQLVAIYMFRQITPSHASSQR